MPEYAMPNWIRPPDIAEEYYRGLSLGQQAASEQQRLAFQQMQSERDHMMEMQRMQITKAYQDQQIGIRQQELKQEQEKINIQTQDAARRLEGYNKFQQAVASGEDTVGAALKYLSGTGEAGGVGTLAAAFEREKRMRGAIGEPEVKSYGGKQFLVVPGEYGQRPQYHPLNEDPLTRWGAQQEIRTMGEEQRSLQREIAKMEEENLFLLDPPSDTDSKLKQVTRKRYDALKAELAAKAQDLSSALGNIRRGSRLAQPAPGAESPADPEPAQRPWDAAAPSGGAFGPTSDAAAQPSEAFTITAIRPKGGAPAGPSAAGVPAPMAGSQSNVPSWLAGIPAYAAQTAVGRGAQNLFGPLFSGVKATAPIVEQGARNLVPTGLFPALEQGAKNLAAPLIPSSAPPANQVQIDPATGLPIDPATGQPVSAPSQ